MVIRNIRIKGFEMLKQGPERTPKDMVSEMFNYNLMTHSIVLCLIFSRAAVTFRLQRFTVSKWRLFIPSKNIKLAKRKCNGAITLLRSPEQRHRAAFVRRIPALIRIFLLLFDFLLYLGTSSPTFKRTQIQRQRQ